MNTRGKKEVGQKKPGGKQWKRRRIVWGLGIGMRQQIQPRTEKCGEDLFTALIFSRRKGIKSIIQTNNFDNQASN